MSWTSERVERLTWLWAEGLSARQIADKLGGVTRNAVIGKAHRLNLQRGAPQPEVEPEPPPPPPIETFFQPAPEVKSWMCRWRTDDPGRFSDLVRPDRNLVPKLGILALEITPRCSYILPSIVRRGDLAVAVSTGGKAPALAVRLRQGLERELGTPADRHDLFPGHHRRSGTQLSQAGSG